MKKVVFLFILVLAIVAIGGPFYLIVTNRVILRAPVLYTTNPRVYYAYGDVRYKADPGEAEWHKAIVGTSLPAGAVLETGPDSRPIVPNDTEPHRAENRRVEFVIVQ